MFDTLTGWLGGNPTPGQPVSMNMTDVMPYSSQDAQRKMAEELIKGAAHPQQRLTSPWQVAGNMADRLLGQQQLNQANYIDALKRFSIANNIPSSPSGPNYNPQGSPPAGGGQQTPVPTAGPSQMPPTQPVPQMAEQPPISYPDASGQLASNTMFPWSTMNTSPSNYGPTNLGPFGGDPSLIGTF